MPITRDRSPENLTRGRQLREALLAAINANPQHALQFYDLPAIRRLAASSDKVSNSLAYLAKNNLISPIPVRVKGTGVRFAYVAKGVAINGATAVAGMQVVDKVPAKRTFQPSGISLSFVVGNREVKVSLKEARKLYEELHSFFKVA